MGKTYYTIDGALDGVSETILRQLTAGVAPDWFYPGIPRYSGDDRTARGATSGDDYLNALQEAARGEFDRCVFTNDRQHAFFRVYTDDQPGGRNAPEEAVLPPEPVLSRIQQWENANLGPIMVRDGEAEFSLGPHAKVEFDDEGKPLDISMWLVFGN